MLDAFIIDGLRRREQQDKQADDNRLHLPVPAARPLPPAAPDCGQSADVFDMPGSPPHETIVIDMAPLPPRR